MPANLRPSPKEAAVRDAKRLLRISRVGALATLDLDDGSPLVTLVGVASDWDGAPLFLLSELSRHTQNLARSARASLLLTSDATKGDPLNHPRLTLGGLVLPHEESTSRERYIRRNPKSKLYASFADFSIRRMQIGSIHFNGGFGRADAISVEELLAPPGDLSDIIADHARLCEKIDALGDSRLGLLAEAKRGTTMGWRAVGVDAEGFDLAAGAAVARVDFSTPAFDAPTWLSRLEERVANAESPSS